jgi:manganese oxidase
MSLLPKNQRMVISRQGTAQKQLSSRVAHPTALGPQVHFEPALMKRALLFLFFLFPALALAQHERHREITPAPATGAKIISTSGKIRHYYIAAEDVQWNFAPSGRDLLHNEPISRGWSFHPLYPKTRYIEYTDDTFTVRKPQPEWLGILGPIIRAEVGDHIVVHFLNRSMLAHSIHSHGVRYDKDSEGAHYVVAGRGARIPNGGRFDYHWQVTPESGPQPGSLSSRVWLYHGHLDEPTETQAGLIGPLIITAKGKARPDGSPIDVAREFVALFMVFDQERMKETGLIHTINGLSGANLPGLAMVEGEKVRWHVMAMGNERDVHTPHWHGEVLTNGHDTFDVTEIFPATTKTADMIADNPGTWMFQCHVSDHMEGGMMAFYTIVPRNPDCPVKITGGEVWNTNDQYFTFTNTTRKPIRSIIFQSAVYLGAAYLVNANKRFQLDQPVAPGVSARVKIDTRYASSRKVEGWVFLPSHITYADGSSWRMRNFGDCFHVFWADAKRPQPLALPPEQFDDESADEE